MLLPESAIHWKMYYQSYVQNRTSKTKVRQDFNFTLILPIMKKKKQKQQNFSLKMS